MENSHPAIFRYKCRHSAVSQLPLGVRWLGGFSGYGVDNRNRRKWVEAADGSGRLHKHTYTSGYCNIKISIKWNADSQCLCWWWATKEGGWEKNSV